MQRFTIKDIENLTGIKAHTLRIWEQRYDFFTAQRKESLHRFYENEDLKKLLRIAFLYHNGWKISKIAQMTTEEVIKAINTSESGNTSHAAFVTQLIESAVDFDEYSFIGLLDVISGKLGFEDCITKVCYPYLQKVGLLWFTNNIIPAQEHFTSYIIQNRIIRETEMLTRNKRLEPEIVLFCPRGEFHELPLLFINYLLRKNGWGTIFMGSNVSLQALEPLGELPQVRSFYLHLITNFTGFFVDDYLEKLCRTFPEKKIYASGAVMAQSQRAFTNLVKLMSDEAIYGFIRKQRSEDISSIMDRQS
jgi:DNA-binding transcriptional MerR regulator